MDRLAAEDRFIPTAEYRLLDILRVTGPLTLDALSTLFNMGWAEAFSIVDRLSRSRHIALHRTGTREYLVSIRAVA